MTLARCLLAALAIALTSTIGAAERPATAAFSAQEIEIITRYYHTVALPAPKYGRGANRLPRGIAKNLARGKPLPPGIAKRQLPVGLVGGLPPPPVGYERIVVDGKILLVEMATQIIHDVLSDVLFH
jgi:Ni/Co efflux regulator RcnB